MRRFFLVVLAAGLPSCLFSAGGVGPDFLRIDPHAKTSAMSDAYCALADDTNAVIFNPAGLSAVKITNLSFTHYTSFSDTNYEYIAAALPDGDSGGTGFSAMADYTCAFRQYDDTGQDVGAVDNKDVLISGAYARAFNGFFSAGINVKGFFSQLYKYSKCGAAADIGLLMDMGTVPALFAGAVVQNLGFQTAYIDVVDTMPVNLKAGLGLRAAVFDKTTAAFAVDINRLLTKDELPTLDFGADVNIQSVLSFRAGYGFRHDVLKLSLGIGLTLDQLAFSYSYQPFDVLGTSHRLSLDVAVK